MNNQEISSRLRIFSELLEVHEEDERLSRIITGASFRIRQMSEPVLELSPGDLKKLFRIEVVDILNELKNTGSIKSLEEIIQLTPAGIFDMMRIKGLGGKKISALWKNASIDTVDLLLKACKNGSLEKLPGFGSKTQSNIINEINNLRQSENYFHYASIVDEANKIVNFLNKNYKTYETSLCGEIRRKNNIIQSIEIVTNIPQTKIKSNKLVRSLITIQKYTKNKTTGITLNEFPFVIHHTSKKEFISMLFKLTGNEEHVKIVLSKIKSKINFNSETDLYEKAGFKYMEPEIRENLAEWKFILSKKKLVELQDIKGVVHNHTTWSDGVDTLKDFVTECKKRKFEYVVISDHSKNAHYAGGLKEERVLKQLKEIDILNKELSPFKIFKSIECDILISGELDYSPDILKKFDLVIISIHQLLKMDEVKATKRLLKAIENPYTTILGHMTGRQLLIRPGYPLNFKKIIDACAANNVVIEINANPYRLDVDWSHIPYILKKGVMISINPDAHSILEIENIKWGVESARKGGLTKEMTWNAMGTKKIEEWLNLKHKSLF
jgi:DNA polymerase (family 10)